MLNFLIALFLSLSVSPIRDKKAKLVMSSFFYWSDFSDILVMMTNVVMRLFV